MTKKSDSASEIRKWERERKRALREELRSRGWVKVEFYAPPDEAQKLKELAVKLKTARDE